YLALMLLLLCYAQAQAEELQETIDRCLNVREHLIYRILRFYHPERNACFLGENEKILKEVDKLQDEARGETAVGKAIYDHVNNLPPASTVEEQKVAAEMLVIAKIYVDKAMEKLNEAGILLERGHQILTAWLSHSP
ncbi:MAG TPA: hypothetical protein VJI74_01635, partial [Candidatus Paceibacterota bacterium]